MKKDIQLILCPVDFSQASINAFHYALHVASTVGAKVQLLHVVVPEVEALDLPIVAAEATRSKIAAARSLLESVVLQGTRTWLDESPKGASPPKVNWMVEVGAPSTVILDVAQREGASIIVMGMRREHTFLERILGSVTQQVLRRALNHVWIVPYGVAFESPQHVAYIAQLSDADPWHIYEAQQLLEAWPHTLHVVHVHRDGMDTSVPCAELEAFFNKKDSKQKVVCHELTGSAIKEVLSSFLKQAGIQLLVMWSHHRSLLQRLFLGTHSVEMGLYAQLPLLVLKR